MRPPRGAYAGYTATVGGQETERAAAWVVVDVVDRLVVLTVGKALDSREVDRDHQDVATPAVSRLAPIRPIVDGRDELFSASPRIVFASRRLVPALVVAATGTCQSAASPKVDLECIGRFPRAPPRATRP